jgi:AI-2 transport protein TqsA
MTDAPANRSGGDDDSKRPALRARDRMVRWGIYVLAIVALVVALRAAAVVVLPLIVALWLAMLLWPIHARVRSAVPSWLAAGAVVATIFVAIGLVATWGWYAVDSAIEHTRDNASRYAQQYTDVRAWLDERGVPNNWLPDLNHSGESGEQGAEGQAPEENGDNAENAGRDDAAGPDDVDESGARRPSSETDTTEPGFTRFGDPVSETRRATGPRRPDADTFLSESRRQIALWIGGGLQSGVAIIAAILLTIVFVYFALVEFPTWRAWSRDTFGVRRTRFLGVLLTEYTHLIRMYFLSKLISGVVSGTATGLWLWAMGVPMPLVWAILTFVMNFVPNIGAIISGVPPTLLAFLELGLWEGFAVGVGLILIESAVGNLLDPLIQGNTMDLTPFVVLASLLFWGWLWGIVGAVLAPTLTAAIWTTIRHLARDDTIDEQIAESERADPGG